MRKSLMIATAVLGLAGATLATTQPAEARYGGGYGGGRGGYGYHGGGYGYRGSDSASLVSASACDSTNALPGST